ncbi:MAG: serine protease [Deltaproteobacteria bacterium]|nr:serine protease [Deltaproteobacteria bacterium]
MAALIGIEGPNLDLILHSPGGSAEAVAQIVQYLRPKYVDLRVIIPQHAMSAATMLACAANEIIMGRHSALGPIDPQLTMPSRSGVISVSAQSILDEFASAQTSINRGDNPLLWIERVRAYAPGFLVHCQQLIKLSNDLVTRWLADYMFSDLPRPDAETKADEIASWLSDNNHFFTHGRPICYDLALSKGLRVTRLEDDQGLQERVLTVFHATISTFHRTTCIKIVENHMGKGSYSALEQLPDP